MRARWAPSGNQVATPLSRGNFELRSPVACCIVLLLPYCFHPEQTHRTREKKTRRAFDVSATCMSLCRNYRGPTSPHPSSAIHLIKQLFSMSRAASLLIHPRTTPVPSSPVPGSRRGSVSPPSSPPGTSPAPSSESSSSRAIGIFVRRPKAKIVIPRMTKLFTVQCRALIGATGIFLRCIYGWVRYIRVGPDRRASPEKSRNTDLPHRVRCTMTYFIF